MDHVENGCPVSGINVQPGVEKKKIMVCVPTRGEMDFRFVHCLVELMVDCERMPEYHFTLAVFPKMMVPQARELAAEKAVELGFDYCFMVDDDMILPRGIMARLLSHNKDIVGSMSFERLGEHNPNIYAMTFCEKSEDRDGALIGSIKWSSIINYAEKRDENGLCEVDAIGFGCVLINTRIFKKRADGPQFMPTWFMAQFNVGEDLFFCFKAKEVGLKVYADCHPDWMAGHLGEKPIIDETMMLQKLKEKQDILDSQGVTYAK